MEKLHEKIRQEMQKVSVQNIVTAVLLEYGISDMGIYQVINDLKEDPSELDDSFIKSIARVLGISTK